MKKLFFGALVACAAATFVGCGNSTPKADLKTDVDTMSYAFFCSESYFLQYKEYLDFCSFQSVYTPGGLK